MEELGEAVNEMKSGKAPGLDGFPLALLKKGGMAVLEWLVRLLNLSLDMWVVSMVWRGTCIVPLCKGMGDKCECSKSRGISLLSVVGKLYPNQKCMHGAALAISGNHCLYLVIFGMPLELYYFELVIVGLR